MNPLKPKTAILVLALVVIGALLTAPFASAKSPIRVGVADQSPAMFAHAAVPALNIKRTRYFVPADVMQNTAERAKAARVRHRRARRRASRRCCTSRRRDLRSKRGPLVSTAAYKRNVGRIVVYFRKLGVRDFGAWNEVNHKTQETWNRVGNAVSYFKSMYTAVHGRCPTVRGRRPRRARPGRRRHATWRASTRACQLDVAQAADGRRHPQLLRRQPQPLDRHGEDHHGPRARTTARRSSGSPRPARWRASGGAFPYNLDAPGVADQQHVHVRHALPRRGRRARLLLQLLRHRTARGCGHDVPLRRRARRTRRHARGPVYNVFKAKLANFSR